MPILLYLQDIDPKLLLQGTESLMKVQITHYDESQTMLGITMAHVLAGTLLLTCVMQSTNCTHGDCAHFTLS